MNNAWQLAVVDWELYKKYAASKGKDHILNRCFVDKSTQPFKDGTIVFIIKPYFMSANGELGAYLWIPSKKKYGSIIIHVLYPVITAKDAIEMNLKFGIDLSPYL